jgi:hypothetical protein
MRYDHPPSLFLSFIYLIFCIWDLGFFAIIMENNLIEITHQTNKPILTTHRLISLNQNLPFCCIVSESTVAYIAGCSFIIENIRTVQQEILWVGQNYHEIVKVEKKMSNYGPMKIVMLLRN